MSSLLAVLLHQGGWDEVLMVAVGLGLAYLVIVWSGRRKTDDEDKDEGDAEDGAGHDGLGHDGMGVPSDKGSRAADGPRDRPTMPST